VRGLGGNSEEKGKLPTEWRRFRRWLEASGKVETTEYL